MFLANTSRLAYRRRVNSDLERVQDSPIHPSRTNPSRRNNTESISQNRQVPQENHGVENWRRGGNRLRRTFNTDDSLNINTSTSRARPQQNPRTALPAPRIIRPVRNAMNEQIEERLKDYYGVEERHRAATHYPRDNPSHSPNMGEFSPPPERRPTSRSCSPGYGDSKFDGFDEPSRDLGSYCRVSAPKAERENPMPPSRRGDEYEFEFDDFDDDHQSGKSNSKISHLFNINKFTDLFVRQRGSRSAPVAKKRRIEPRNNILREGVSFQCPKTPFYCS